MSAVELMLADQPKSRWLTSGRRPRSLLIALILVVMAGAVSLSFASRMTPHVRDQAVAALNARFQSDVDLETLQVSVFPRPEVTGEGLTLRHRGRTDVPPLIKLKAYTAGAGLWGLVRSPVRLKTLELDGLEISIPPGGLRAPGTERGATAATPLNKPPETVNKPPEAPRADEPSGHRTPRLVVDRIVARGARLEVVPRNKAKLPRVFDIYDLRMEDLGDGGGAKFEATLTNPTPRGDITTRGRFGPWHMDDPGHTPLSGTYDFRHANLNTIKGIAGTLSSVGTFAGTLETLDVKGETDTPDFSVDVSGQPVPMKTRFHAIVDGTNGDTRLQLVEAQILKTAIIARGAVVRDEDIRGRKVTLDVKINDGRVEDILRLAVKSAKPLMTGRVQLHSRFHLPAGQRDLFDRLELAGTVTLKQAHFTNVNVQHQVNILSRRGRGEAEGAAPGVVSSLSSAFTLRAGVLTFTNLSFSVPGAVVQLAGTYDVKRETLDFTGDLLLDAKLSEVTTGVKSLLARIVQPFFRRKGGGSKLPIKVTGRKDKPEFSLDLKRRFR